MAKRTEAHPREGLHEPKVISHLLEDDGIFPNNPQLPLLVYEQAFRVRRPNLADFIEDVYGENGWDAQWRYGIYDFHHYHSTTHETLGCFAGRAEVQFGGPTGPIIAIQTGDAVIIPAGVAHCCIHATDDFQVVGAYPEGHSYDMCYGKKGERPKTDEKIAKIPMPESDPVYGDEGPLLEHWAA